jgi:regulator of RNase E activity RraA
MDYGDQLKLKRFYTPAIYNGLERLLGTDKLETLCNQEALTDYMPWMGPMIGYAVTVTIKPGEKEYAENGAQRWDEYRLYVASVPGPKIVVVQDLDKPRTFGAFWGEVNSNVHKALGCVGSITDGAVRDIDEVAAAGFKVLASRMCVGHAWSTPVEWGSTVNVFGTEVRPGQLICADKYGFLIIPEQYGDRILDAVEFLDRNECETLIRAARLAQFDGGQRSIGEINSAAKVMSEASAEKF